MKKKVLSFLLVVMMLVTMLPMTTFAMEMEMSDEFKSYLNEDGKLEVTFTSTAPSKESLVTEYVWATGSSSVFGEYFFNVDPDTYNEETDTCLLSRIHAMTWEVLETFEVEVVFKEKISEKFASILTDGKLILPSTSKNMTSSWISSYVFRFSDDEYNFNVARYCEDPMSSEYKDLVSEDFTKATIKMSKNDSSECEIHVVQLERITEQSDNFKKYLNEDGKLEINSIVPEDEGDFGTMYQVLYTDDMENGVYVGWISEDFMSADLVVGNEVHTVDVVYNYNADVQKKLQPLIDNFPEDIEYFLVEDMELVNYWVNTVHSDDINTLAGYSGELKNYLSNYNVELIVEDGAGWDEPFITQRLGMAAITYEGSAYYVNPYIGSHADHIIYVPDNTGDTKEELIAAAQKRIDEYLGAGNNVTVSYAGTALDAWIDASYELTRHWWEEEDPDLTKEEWVMGFLPAYEDFGADVLYIDGVNEDDDTFFVTVTSGDITKKYNVIIRKDSSKMITPTYATADMENDIEISSSSSAIPLDTAISSEKLTSGTVYDKIMELLDVDVNETFDINLYSNSLQKNITKLQNGTFEVKIPVSDTLKDKKLVAYYVDANNKVVEYEVTVKDGCAVFATDHFSIYTIAEKTIVEPSKPSVPEVVAPENNAGGSTFEEKAETVVEKVPFTEEEKAQVEAGAEVKITLDVKDITETVSKEDKAKVEAEVAKVDDQTVGMYLDVNMFKQVGTNEAVKVPELNGKVKIQFTVPDALLVKDEKMNREYNVIRIHDGVTTVLDAKFDAETKSLVFETDCFSTYALVYKDVPKTPVSETPDTEIPDTGDHTYLFAWFMLFVVGGCAITFGIKSKKQY